MLYYILVRDWVQGTRLVSVLLQNSEKSGRVCVCVVVSIEVSVRSVSCVCVLVQCVHALGYELRWVCIEERVCGVW